MVSDENEISAESKQQGLEREDLNTDYMPVAVTEISSSTRLVLEIEDVKEGRGEGQTSHMVYISAMLHGKIERIRYVAHAAHYVYKTWVVADNGSAFTVDEIDARIQSGNDSFHKRVTNTSGLSRQDEVNDDNGFRPASLVATARKGNASATVEVKLC